MATKKTKAAEAVKEKKALKARTYKLLPPYENTKWFKLQSSDKPKNRLTYFDQETGHTKSLRYAANHDSPFIDIQDEKGGMVIRENIIFEHGILNTNLQDVRLQEFMSKHPGNQANGGKKFFEINDEKDAEKEVDLITLQAEALSIALDMDINDMESIMRPIIGASVSTMTTAELKRDTFKYAQADPQGFMDDVKNPYLMNKSLAYKAVDLNIISLADGGKTVKWADNGKILTTVPFGEDTFDHLSQWFTSDEGMEILTLIGKKLK